MRGQWWAKLRSWPRRRQALTDLDEELDAQLGLAIEDFIERGLSPETARIAAHRRLGNRQVARERTRDVWRFPPLDSFVQDLRYGSRGWRRAPGFALIVVLTMALGIGATTAIFSVVYTVLLRPLPYPEGDCLVWIGESSAEASGISVTWVNFRHWQNRSRAFDALAGFELEHATLTGRGEARLLRFGVVTNGFFDLLGVRPLLDRLLTADDDRPGSQPVIVLSHEFWRTQLGGDRQVLGTALTLEGRTYEIVGVAPSGLQFFERPVDGYTALGPRQGSVVRRDTHGWSACSGDWPQASVSRPPATTWMGSCDALRSKTLAPRASIAVRSVPWPAWMPVSPGRCC